MLGLRCKMLKDFKIFHLLGFFFNANVLDDLNLSSTFSLCCAERLALYYMHKSTFGGCLRSCALPAETGRINGGRGASQSAISAKQIAWLTDAPAAIVRSITEQHYPTLLMSYYSSDLGDKLITR